MWLVLGGHSKPFLVIYNIQVLPKVTARWAAMFNSLDMSDRLTRVIDFARNKLRPPTTTEDATFDMHVAWLGIRIILDLDARSEIARKLQSRLVESFLRLVVSIPSDRMSMDTCAPSEPILAEAAARLMHSSPDFNGFEVLLKILEKNLLAKGDRGEIGARLFTILAYDRAVDRSLRNHPHLTYFTYHRPIRFLDYLRALFVDEVHNKIMTATPIDNDPRYLETSTITLDTAFEDAWVHFSHFSLAGDHLVTQLQNLPQFFLRGTILQCWDNQQGLDNIAPILFAKTEADIIKSTDSSLYGEQIKNRLHAEGDVLHTNAFIPATTTTQRPVISILFELGEENPPSDVISTIQVVHQTRPKTRQESYTNQRNHYQITVHGLAALEMKEADRTNLARILNPRKDFEDFPRREEPENLELLQMCKPRFTLLGDDRKAFDASMKGWVYKGLSGSEGKSGQASTRKRPLSPEVSASSI